MYAGLTTHGVPTAAAGALSHLPPTGYLFAAFLGFNPLKELLGPHVLGALSSVNAHMLVGKSFFPSLISGPFKQGLTDVLIFAALMCLVAALASWLRGGKFVHEDAHTHGVRPTVASAAPKPAGQSASRSPATTAASRSSAAPSPRD
jgi:hypothetical protein